MMRAGPEAKSRSRNPSVSYKIGHVIECEGAFKAVLGQLTPREHCTCVVDQNIYAQLLIGDLSRYPFHFLQAQEIGKMYRMGNTRGAAA